MEIDKSTISVVRQERFGRYHIAEAQHESGIKGVGISRRSFKEHHNEEVGKKIACGRAIEAVCRKLSGKDIRSVLMG